MLNPGVVVELGMLIEVLSRYSTPLPNTSQRIDRISVGSEVPIYALII